MQPEEVKSLNDLSITKIYTGLDHFGVITSNIISFYLN